MKVLVDIAEILPKLDWHLKKFGYSCQHNLNFLSKYYPKPGSQLIYFDFQERGGWLAWRNKDFINIIDEPLTPLGQKTFILTKTLNWLYSLSDIKKILIEDCSLETRKIIANNIKFPWKIQKPNILWWPILDLVEFDENLSGQKWKRLRYVRNIFNKMKDISLVEAINFPKERLISLVHYWRQNRKVKERVYWHQYVQAIDDNFRGIDITKVVLRGQDPVAMIAGWKIPNSKGFYLFLNIHDYSIENIGEYANLNLLREVKNLGFDYINFGGADKKSLIFKLKFQPNKIYKTYSFYISKK